MEGQIRVTSDIGKGTVFSVELPFQNAHDLAPKKLRTLFPPTPSSIKFPSPPSPVPPPARSPGLPPSVNGSSRNRETIISGGELLAPRRDMRVELITNSTKVHLLVCMCLSPRIISSVSGWWRRDWTISAILWLALQRARKRTIILLQIARSFICRTHRYEGMRFV